MTGTELSAPRTCVDDAFATWRREIAKAEEWFATIPEADLGREVELAGGEYVASIRDVVVHDGVRDCEPRRPPRRHRAQ